MVFLDRLLMILFSLVVSSGSISLSIYPPKNQIYSGDSVTLECQSDVGNSLNWFRQRADIREAIGTGVQLNDFIKTKRYWISRDSKQSGIKSTLAINHIKYQDSGIFICEIGGKTKEVGVSVCDTSNRNKEDSVCTCLRKRSWADPTCFDEPPTVSNLKSKHKKAIIALSFFFGLACIACMVLGIIVIKDRYFTAQDVQRRQAATDNKPYEKHDNQGFESEFVDCYKMQIKNSNNENNYSNSLEKKEYDNDLPSNGDLSQSSRTASVDVHNSYIEETPIKNRRENLGKFSSNNQALNELSPRGLYSYAERTSEGPSVHV
ncbi:DgyrCDS5795 [Dimorphilus gyrociliatus]|uniref:DgyrCDS5795 n=1 Tax=Dimorphilus gyrociliatus TaxID=2664684 RepID=A0A7I8VMJ1_9ANNE|nr:DgyrCDS5795 [Dimorphilus gyrociliatus]